MKNYFEYKINKKEKERLNKFYDNLDLQQHSFTQEEKTNIKLKRIKRGVVFLKDDVVLDYGCSRGFLLKKISKEIKRGVGVDISNKIIDYNKEKNNCSNIEFFYLDDFNQRKNDKYSKIFLVDILEHAFSPDEIIKSLKKRLSADSRLIVEVPSTGFLSEFFTKRFHEGHLRYYDPEYLKKYFKKFGFKTEKLFVYNSVPFSSYFLKSKILWLLMNFFVNLIPHKVYPYFGEIIIVLKYEN